MQTMMKAALIHSFEGIQKIAIEEVPIPNPEDHEVQIAIKYAGINPIDWKISEGYLRESMKHQFPVILGWDAAGEISKVGKKVKNFKEGDPIFACCRKEQIHDGSFAEFICLSEENVAKKPKNLSFAQAATIPLGGLTAWQSLYDTAKIRSGENILVHAGGGGVGGFALQLAKLAGSHVITTASRKNFDYVKSFGADEIIDYQEENFADALKKKYPSGIDVIYDTVGGETLSESYNILKKGGRLVTIAGTIDRAVAEQKYIQAFFVFVQPNGKELNEIASLYNDDQLLPPKIQEIPFHEIQSALNLSRTGHVQGKLVLRIA
jgi:NADPH:quinone reductase-like Zn-dependent oxidoreductase